MFAILKSCLMGAKSRYRPKNLAQKLLQIRNALGLSQSEMLRRLGAEDSFSTARISEYESGVREPSLWILLNYGRVARVHLESLIDDNATLPDRLPGNFNFRRSQQKLAHTSTRSQAKFS
jgi:transcriptional regulator with XRE-family HTH domain